MPQMLVSALLPYVVSGLGALGVGSAAIVASAVAITTGLAYLGLAAAAFLVSEAFKPPAPEAPKPEDGKYNLRQTVPHLTYVLGRVKKGGDYLFLAEKGGTAYHITAWAGHRIKGFVEHWLHDELVTLDGNGFVTSPDHFTTTPAIGDPKRRVRILTRLGAAASTAYANVVSAFPSDWTNDHRGDGLATVCMTAESVNAEELQKTYPHGMPQQLSVGEGNDQLIDPRTGAPGYSENFAVFRYWHLTHPVGGKLTRAEMYDPDWAHAADVCDQTVLDRDGNPLPRYHGGLWFRANNDPVQIGRTMDQAGDMVIYERPDGTIGVHAGEYVEPDIRLTEDDITLIAYDPNKRKATNVLAVRGRYTDPDKGWNTIDAAIYGIPYPTEDERTKTVENVAVQRHNHMNRLQKLAHIRANAPRVRCVAHFEPARMVPYRRFVKVHYPRRGLVEAVIEIINKPTLSLRNLTYEFEGIVIPGALLYLFNPATEEGEPGSNVSPIGGGSGVPGVSGFDVIVDQETVAGGSTAAFALASWDEQSDALTVEVQWQPVAGGAEQSGTAALGQGTFKTPYLPDGVDYRFRARNWSAGTPSGWTGYVIRTMTADATPPGVVTFNGPVDVSVAGQATINWTAPNSANYFGARVYTNTVDDFGTAGLAATEYGSPNVADGVTVTLAADEYFAWIVAFNPSGVAASPVATGAFTVT